MAVVGDKGDSEANDIAAEAESDSPELRLSAAVLSSFSRRTTLRMASCSLQV